MRISYWYARCKNDSDVYSHREKTKKACLSRCQKSWPGELNNGKPAWTLEYCKPVRVTVEYDSGFDLLINCTCEGRLYWEPYNTE